MRLTERGRHSARSTGQSIAETGTSRRVPGRCCALQMPSSRGGPDAAAGACSLNMPSAAIYRSRSPLARTTVSAAPCSSLQVLAIRHWRILGPRSLPPRWTGGRRISCLDGKHGNVGYSFRAILAVCRAN
jgi:hypothetical protein